MSLYALLVGGMSQMREFVKESDIYKRERLVNLRIVPYVSSKVWVALLLAFYQGLAYTVMHYLAFEMPGGAAGFMQVYITMVLATMTGMMLGLLASALAPYSASAPLTLIMLIVPLIVLSGALAPIPPNISQVASTRWAFQGLLGIVGAGSDIAADACWYLDEDLSEGMTLGDKAYIQCKCMCVKVFEQRSCNFPGVGQYYTALIGGEELHNNHHTYPTSAKLSSKWFEFDLGWLYIRVLSALGLATVLRVAPVPKVAAPRPGVDLQTLQAVIANRYDLLSRYARGLRSTLNEELRRLALPASEQRRFAALRRWLRKSDVQSIPPAQQQTLRELLGRSGALRTLVEMRAELAAIWGRSSASREQMVANLQDWIARAEASGIRALQEAALRIRSYAPTAA